MISMSAIQHEQSETHKKSTWINGISLKSDAYGIVKKKKRINQIFTSAVA